MGVQGVKVVGATLFFQSANSDKPKLKVAAD